MEIIENYNQSLDKTIRIFVSKFPLFEMKEKGDRQNQLSRN